MKKTNKPVVLAGIAAVSLILTLSLANERPAQANGAMQPFHAVVYVATAATFDGCTIANHETGSGLAYHLGRISIVTNETADLKQCPPVAGPNDAAVRSTFQMATAGGELDGEYETEATLNMLTGEVYAKGFFRITSGSGQFSNATGFGQLTAYGALTGNPSDVPLAGEAYGVFDGFIQYRGTPQR